MNDAHQHDGQSGHISPTARPHPQRLEPQRQFRLVRQARLGQAVGLVSAWRTTSPFGAVGSGEHSSSSLLDGQGGRAARWRHWRRRPGTWLSIFVDDVDAVHARCQREQVEVTLPPRTSPGRPRNARPPPRWPRVPHRQPPAPSRTPPRSRARPLPRALTGNQRDGDLPQNNSAARHTRTTQAPETPFSQPKKLVVAEASRRAGELARRGGDVLIAATWSSAIGLCRCAVLGRPHSRQWIDSSCGQGGQECPAVAARCSLVR